MKARDANDVLRQDGPDALRQAFDAGVMTNGADAKKKPRFELIRFGAVLLASTAAYVVKGVIPRSGITVVWGPPKCGKSFWTFDLAMHVALGLPYRGRRVHQGAVVYLALEGGHGFRTRIEAFRKCHDVTDAPFYLIINRTNLVRDHRELIDDVRSQVGATAPALVVIDTLNRSLAGSESKDEDMAAYIQAADAVREAFDCAVIIVHHCGVDGTRPRGHTSLTGAADAQHAVTRDVANNITVTVEWLKDGPEGAIIVSRLEQVEVGTDEDGEPITSCVVVQADAVPTTATASVKGAAKVALDLLREAIADAGSIPPANSHIPPNTQTISVDTWRAYAYKGTIAESDKPDSRRQAFVRAFRRLKTLGIIGFWNDQVWIAGHARQ